MVIAYSVELKSWFFNYNSDIARANSFLKLRFQKTFYTGMIMLFFKRRVKVFLTKLTLKIRIGFTRKLNHHFFQIWYHPMDLNSKVFEKTMSSIVQVS